MAKSPENTVPDYTEMPLGKFLEAVASGEPAPGGGSVAAICVALAAGLCGMVARFSADRLADADTLAGRSDELRQRTAPLAHKDAEGYGRVLTAFRLPREQEDRDERIRQALSEAADVPLALAETGAEVAELAVRLASKGNPNLRGDAVAATLLAEAGVRAAAALVEINAPGDENGRVVRARDLVGAAASAREAVEALE